MHASTARIDTDNGADHFVSWSDRAFVWRQVTLGDMKVSAANTTDLHLDQHLAPGRFWSWHFH
jgi:hypothetical protein